MPDKYAIGSRLAAGPDRVTSIGLSQRLPRGALSVLNRKLATYGLLSQQQGTNQRTRAD
jgi:hypothetical protein